MNKHQKLQTSDIASQEHQGEPEAADEPISRQTPGTARRPIETDVEAPLLPTEDGVRLQRRWQEIQAGFVDEPRKMVEDADALVAEVMQQIAVAFAAARQGLEAQWASGDDVSTEDLRQALTRYRSFFQRLLTA